MEAPGGWASLTTRCSVRPTAVTRATEKSGLARATRMTGCPFLIFARERQTHTPSSAELRKALARFQRYCLWLGGLFFVSCSTRRLHDIYSHVFAAQGFRRDHSAPSVA